MRSRCLTVYLLFCFLISVSIPFLFHFLCYLFQEKKRILRNERDAKKKPTKPFKNKKASVKLKKKKKRTFSRIDVPKFSSKKRKRCKKIERFAEEKKTKDRRLDNGACAKTKKNRKEAENFYEKGPKKKKERKKE